jgi:hypothetical protein
MESKENRKKLKKKSYFYSLSFLQWHFTISINLVVQEFDSLGKINPLTDELFKIIFYFFLKAKHFVAFFFQ